MKKMIALLLVAGFLCVCTVGCGDSKTTAGGPAKTGTTAPTGK
ncbi:MAG TPA: hypothetical protein VN688_09375 [Gemmataceae bacterium]|nr:hypothetical protein [Gemmataceae bacterium]